MITYRVGEGQTSGGYILDKDTKWYTNYNEALKYAMKTNKNIYRKSGNNVYTLYYEKKNR